jgi:asparagine synthase (glutamine-hydrolysing)
MWELAVDSKAGTKLNWQTKTASSLIVFIDQPFVQDQNEHWSVAVIGKIKPYGKAYGDPKKLDWLLSHIETAGSFVDLYEQLSGFFILIVGNKLSGEIRVFNDHLGTLPVYWTNNADGLSISTQLIMLKSESSKISNQAIYDYFYFHCIPAPLTLYEGILKMQPGVCLISSDSEPPVTETVYKPRYTYSKQNSAALQKQCRDVISDAVSWNASKNCGAFLSGGLDSSSVSGMLAKNEGEAKTFSIGFKAKGYDETKYALITSKHFGTEHKTHYLEPDEILENIVDVVSSFEEPFGNSSALAAFVCADFAKKNGVDSLLAGDGGDEIFAGNERYVTQKIFDVYGKIPSPIRGMLDLIFKKSPIGSLPLLSKGRSYIQQAKVTLPDRLQTYNFLNRMDRTEIFDADFFASVDTQHPSNSMRERYESCPSDNPLEKLLYLDWKFTLSDNDLVKVTRMCEKVGVDVRYPLLEKEVVDFACTVPTNQKLPGMKLRDFYKKSFTGFLADETINKPKHGFGLPFGVWMKEHPELLAMTNKYLDALRKRNIINSSFIDKALEIYRSGDQGYYGVLIWIMLVLEIWLQKNEGPSK